MTSILDPQLSAFFAAEPGQLTPPAAEAPETNHHRKELELAIAAAVIVGVKVVRSRLAVRQENVDTARSAAHGEWAASMPWWMRTVLPAVLELYRLGNLEGSLTASELQAIATSYVESLGEYIGESSAEALQAGLQQQLNHGWNERIAWQRSAAAYGLDGRDMKTYVAKAILGARVHPDELIGDTVRLFIDKALLVRADRIGRGEAWTALETGKSLSWMYLQRAGRLPLEALREWDTAEDETTCAVCAPLDHLQVTLDQPFTLPGSGHRLWAPQAHPGCRCHVRLVIPEDYVTKAWTPEESREHPTGAGHRFVRKTPKPYAQVAERERVLDPEVERMLRPVVDAPLGLGSPTGLGASAGLGTPVGLGTGLGTPTGLGAGLATSLGQGLGNAVTAPLGTPEQTRAARREYNLQLHRVIKVIDHRRRALLPPPVKMSQLRVSVDDYTLALGGKLDRKYVLGEPVDFTPAQHGIHENFHGTVRAENPDPWFALDNDLMAEKRGMSSDRSDPGTHEERHQKWEEMTQQAKPLWDESLEDAERITSKLTARQLLHILVKGGALDDKPFDQVTVHKDDLRDAILAEIPAVRDYDQDSSVAEAYADYITFEHPYLIKGGQEQGKKTGAEFYNYLMDLHSNGYYFTSDPDEQVFVFRTDDVRPQDLRSNAIVPTGVYQVVERDYRSAMKHWEGAPLTLHIGVSELHMAPEYPNADRQDR